MLGASPVSSRDFGDFHVQSLGWKFPHGKLWQNSAALAAGTLRVPQSRGPESLVRICLNTSCTDSLNRQNEAVSPGGCFCVKPLSHPSHGQSALVFKLAWGNKQEFWGFLSPYKAPSVMNEVLGRAQGRCPTHSGFLYSA